MSSLASRQSPCASQTLHLSLSSALLLHILVGFFFLQIINHSQPQSSTSSVSFLPFFPLEQVSTAPLPSVQCVPNPVSLHFRFLQLPQLSFFPRLWQQWHLHSIFSLCLPRLNPFHHSSSISTFQKAFSPV